MNMKIKILIVLLAVILGVGVPKGDVFAAVKNLRPQDFNKMYYLAKLGKIGILRNAVNRGLNIDSVNLNGDTGLCIAVKRKDYVAYNSFRMSGANPRHACTYRIHKQYQEFLASTKTVREEKILGNKESLYYDGSDFELNPWILGGIAIGGGLLAFSGSGGGGSSAPLGNMNGSNITTIEPGTGLSGYVENYEELISGEKKENVSNYSFENDELGDINSIKLLPNTIKQADLIKTYYKVENGGILDNRGTLSLGDGVIGIAVHGDKSQAFSKGNIDIKAGNGSIGMSVSNGGLAVNGKDSKEYNDGNIDNGSNTKEGNQDYGNINMSFKGGKEGNSLIGMYADTNSKIINYGNITGTTSVAINSADNEISDNLVTNDGIVEEGDLEEGNEEEGNEEEGEDEEKVTIPNSGSMLGMGLFNFYTGTDLSENVVAATNMGTIYLSAGHNGASGVGVSLVGMGSYIDDMFLNENYNPYFAEQMELENSKDANIKLSYKGEFTISDTALKLGKGGLIGIRADASTKATNLGNIDINLTSTTLSGGVDVAAGMLSVHGAELTNGSKDCIYDGTEKCKNKTEEIEKPIGAISIMNEANSGGVTYGMLASKGDGSQTRIYEWKDPKLLNYGLIDMHVSNSYAMASFDGGEIKNYGVINLGIEQGNSYYTNNYGLYASGSDKSDVANLVNEGIINVNSTQSVAIMNEFSGSVSMENKGTIYLSNKATGSVAIGGNYSTAINNGEIFYKVDNSEIFTYPGGLSTGAGWNLKVDPVASLVANSTGDNATKQYFENNGKMIVGDIIKSGMDYNGTFGTAAIHVSKQGGAVNGLDGKIMLKKAEPTYRQLNVGMYLDNASERAAYIKNEGEIIVDAHHSMGMLNKSNKSATAFNLGTINVNGEYSYGIAGTDNSYVSNGQYVPYIDFSKEDYVPSGIINVEGKNSVGIYAQNAEVYNWGDIHLKNDNTTAILLDGNDVSISNYGRILYSEDNDYEEMVFFGLTNGANVRFEREDGVDIDGYVLSKIFTTESGGSATFTDNSTANVTKKYGRLFIVDGEGSAGNVLGKVNVSEGATGIEAKNGASVSVAGIDASVTVYGNDGNDGEEGEEEVEENDETVSRGIYIEGENTSLTIAKDAGLYVNNGGLGIYSRDDASVTNYANIIVNKGIGYEGYADSKFNNNATIKVYGKSRGIMMYSGGEFVNNANAVIELFGNSESENDALGIHAEEIENYALGIRAEGTENLENKGFIKGYDINEKTMGVHVGRGAEFVNSASGTSGNISGLNVGVKVDNGGTFNNSGDIRGNKYGVVVDAADIENSGTVSGNQYGFYLKGTRPTLINSGQISGNQYGIYAESGTITSTGEISTSGGTGVYLSNANMENYNNINVNTGTGVLVEENGYFQNINGTITVNDGIGIVIKSGGEALNATNGKINVAGTGALGVKVESGGSFTNAGTIEFDSRKNSCVDGGSNEGCEDKNPDAKLANTSSLLSLEDGATFNNEGVVDFRDIDVDFSDKGDEANFVLGKGGSYKASSFDGDILASKNIVLGGFEDTYSIEDAFVGENRGLSASSQSYMFDAKIKDNNNVSDMELNRKSFNELVEEKDLSEFFEMNYNLAHNEKMYDSLKSATNKKEFNAVVESESGKKFYANLPRENMAVVRNITSTEQRKILNDGLDGVSVGANVYRTGKDGIDNLSGYEADIYTASLLNGWKLNKNWNMGLGLNASYVDSQYDDVNSDKENKILMAFMPILYQNNNFKYLGTITAGVGFGSYNRNAMSGNYEADTFDIYYGMNNSVEYSVDMKVAELVAEAELNLQGITSDDAEENNEGFVLKSNNSLSLEAGIGLKLRKTIELAKNRSLMFAVGSKYYHEFLDPYKRLGVTMKGSPVSFDAGYYNEDKNRLKTTAEAMYKDGDLSVGAEISHISEKESNIEGGVGVRYSF